LIDLTSWKSARIAALTAPDGWVNLTDRVDLVQGSQSVGVAADNAVQISAGPDHLGHIVLDGAAAALIPPGSEPIPFGPSPSGYPQLEIAGLLLELHSDGGPAALRVRDLTRPRKIDLGYFPESPEWVLRARWEMLETPANTIVGQKGGRDAAVSVTHRAHFHHDGQDYALLATHWKGDQPMFVIRDATSGHETYGASRFLLGEEMGQGGITLDFNRAYNPPCAFTPLAICPLPPRENILPFAITAGELAP
jgi:uncharacterized protein (DUF1684 family)